MSTAERNRAIKKTLEAAFGKGKVSTKGSRGTGYGWVSVRIAYSPRNTREAQELRGKVMELLTVAKIDIGTYGYDDPGSDYGFGKKINISFDPCREKADHWGNEAWKHHLGREEWDALQQRDQVPA